MAASLRVKAREPMLLFYKDTRRADIVADESPLLVRQSFSPLAERFRTVNGRQVENPVTGDFRPGVAYSASLIVTNPTGIGRRIDVLAQIPAGSIPLEGKPATLSATVEIEPHGVLKLELAFYFPAPGDFAVYPMHVSEEGVVLAHTGAAHAAGFQQSGAAWTPPRGWCSPARAPTRRCSTACARRTSRPSISGAIRWRLKDRAFFLKVAAILRERLSFPAAGRLVRIPPQRCRRASASIWKTPTPCTNSANGSTARCSRCGRACTTIGRRWSSIRWSMPAPIGSPASPA